MNRKKMACMIVALVSAACLTWSVVKDAMVQSHLSKEVLRFHVLANSDTEEDQKIKMQVKEQVLDYLEQEMPKDNQEDASIEKTKAWILEHEVEIETVAKQVLLEEGKKDTVKVELLEDDFPEKRYADVRFPAGCYEALRIQIGEGLGRNWWCCLYPNLCFIDATGDVLPDKNKKVFRQMLSDKEYETITATSKFKIRWFFLPFE